MELFIRAAKVQDSECIARLSRQFGDMDESGKTKTRLSDILVRNDNCAFVATGNGILIGWIYGFNTLRIESHHFVEIGGLVIDENYRRKGIGRMPVPAAIFNIRVLPEGKNDFVTKMYQPIFTSTSNLKL